MSLVSYGESSSSDSEVEDVTVRSGRPQDIRKLLSVLPAPVKGGKGGRKRVKVGVPSLRGQGNDSDDSDSDNPPELKRKAAGRGGGGLTGLLPKPKQATQTVGKVVKPAQPMIPYTLTKTRRPPPPCAQSKRKAKPPRAPSRTADDSDSDGEPVSFFSLSDRTEAPTSAPVSDSSTPASHSLSSELLVGPIPMPDSSTVLHADLRAPDPSPGSTPTGYAETVDTAPTAPKPFSLGEETGWSYPEVASWGEEPFVDHTPATEQSVGQTGPLLGVGPGLSMDEKTFRRLTGGKRKRGRDPGLNDLIEIKGDEVKEEIELYRRHNSEEAIDRLYKPPEGEKPTGQQKKKHQLTYLVHEAKANELKLLKQWGASAATRRDTQMKYGF